MDAPNATTATTPPAETFSLEEIDDLILSLNEAPESIDNLTPAQLEALERRMNPFGSTIYGDEKYTALSFTNMREEYFKKLMLTTMVAFNYQMAEEWTVDVDDLCGDHTVCKEDHVRVVRNEDKDNKDLVNGLYEQYINSKTLEYEEEHGKKTPTEEEMLQWSAEATAHVEDTLKDREVFDTNAFALEQDKKVALQSEQERAVIKRWLDSFFKFNPLNSLQSSFDRSMAKSDPERSKILSTLDTAGNTAVVETPVEVHSSLTHFYEINYEKLREATTLMYEEKPDIEVAVNVYGTFDTLDECSDFVQKNKTTVITNVLTVTNNKWNLIGPFKENRERMDFYNKNTQVLENMLKKREEDAKLGKDLLKNRIRKQKVKNVKQYGKDHPSFIKYKKQVAIGVYDADVTDIVETDDGIEVHHIVEISETGSKLDEDGIPEDAVEIGVTSVNVKTQKVVQSKLYTKADSPGELTPAANTMDI